MLLSMSAIPEILWKHSRRTRNTSVRTHRSQAEVPKTDYLFLLHISMCVSFRHSIPFSYGNHVEKTIREILCDHCVNRDQTSISNTVNVMIMRTERHYVRTIIWL